MKLTGSQIRSLASYALLLLGVVNTLLQQAQAAHLPLPLWANSIVIPTVAGAVMLLSRSLDKANSGNGAGLVKIGSSGAIGSSRGEAGDSAPAAPPNAPPVNTIPMNAVPILSSVLTLLLTNASALDPARQLALLAAAGGHLTEQSAGAAKTLTEAMQAAPTQQLDQTALLAGIAQKADLEKAKNAAAPVIAVITASPPPVPAAMPEPLPSVLPAPDPVVTGAASQE